MTEKWSQIRSQLVCVVVVVVDDREVESDMVSIIKR